MVITFGIFDPSLRMSLGNGRTLAVSLSTAMTYGRYLHSVDDCIHPCSSLPITLWSPCG